MVQLIRTTSSLTLLANLSIRALSTQAQPRPMKVDTSRELIVKYLDGKDNGIAVLGLNRPEARNSLSKSLLRQMIEAVNHIEQDKKVRVLIVRSLIPKIFCAGADLRERAKMEPQEVGGFVSSLRDLMRDIENLSAPTIVALDGHALGGGLEMALACDIRTAAADSKMGLVETKLAIIPGAGGTQRLPRIVGPAIAKEMIFTAKIVDGIEAKQLGLVNRAVPQNKDGDAAYQQALQIAREILPNGPIGVK